MGRDGRRRIGTGQHPRISGGCSDGDFGPAPVIDRLDPGGLRMISDRATLMVLRRGEKRFPDQRRKQNERYNGWIIPSLK